MDQDAITQRLRELAKQHDAGAITDAEYAAGKRALLDAESPTDTAEETLILRTVDPTPPAAPARGGLLWLVVAAGLVILVLMAVVLIGPWLR
jgi:Short C-terminal domain